MWARALSLLLALVWGCGGSSPPADEPKFKKGSEEQPWPPPSLGIPEGGHQAPAPAGPAAGGGAEAGGAPPAAGGPPPPAAGGAPAAGQPAAPQSGPLAGCNPASQGELRLFDCPWGVALYGPGASGGGKARDKAIEGFVGKVLEGSQMKIDSSKSAKMTVGGKALKGRKVSVKNPQPPNALVAEGYALFVSDAPDAKIMACLKAKEDAQAERCQQVFEAFLQSPPP